METAIPFAYCHKRTLSNTSISCGCSLLFVYMSEQTVGSFLKNKGLNFVKFLNDGLPTTHSLPTVFVTEVGMSTFALILKRNRVIVTHRDWAGLFRLIEEQQTLLDGRVGMLERLHLVRGIEEMHDKFWRYLELFADTIQGDNNPTGA